MSTIVNRLTISFGILFLTPLLLEQDFEIITKNNDCFIYFFNKYYGSVFIYNDLLFLSLNDNVLHVENIKEKEREDVNVTYLWHC